jgi:hypothetical protein
MGDALLQFFWIILLAMGTLAVLAIVGLMLVARSLRNIRVPPNADFFDTMHYVPLTLVVLLDLLDLALDVFSAPISWIILDRMGLSSLRNIATVEGLLPFTGPIPTLTVSWLMARLLGLGSFASYGPQAAHPTAPRGGYYDDWRYDDDERYYDDWRSNDDEHYYDDWRSNDDERYYDDWRSGADTRPRQPRPMIIDVDERDDTDERRR